MKHQSNQRKNAGKKQVLANLLLALCTLALVFLVLEISVRLFANDIDLHTKYDKEIGAMRRPNTRGYHGAEGKLVAFEINSIGFREKEITATKPEGVFRIAVIGDSITEAVHVEQGQRYTTILEKKLNLHLQSLKSMGKNMSYEMVEIISFGLGGIGTSEEYHILKKYVAGYSPDLVILQVSIGDVRQNIRSKTDRELEHVAYFDFDETGTLIYVPYKESRWAPVKHVMRKSQLFLFLYKRYVAATMSASSNTDNFPTDYLMFLKEYDAKWIRALNLTGAIILKARQEAALQNASFIVVGSAIREQTDSEFWMGILQKYPQMRSLEWDINNPNEKIDSFCASANLTCINPLQEFRSRQKRVDLYISDGAHLNQNGHEAISDILFEEVRAVLS